MEGCGAALHRQVHDLAPENTGETRPLSFLVRRLGSERIGRGGAWPSGWIRREEADPALGPSWSPDAEPHRSLLLGEEGEAGGGEWAADPEPNQIRSIPSRCPGHSRWKALLSPCCPQSPHQVAQLPSCILSARPAEEPDGVWLHVKELVTAGSRVSALRGITLIK